MTVRELREYLECFKPDLDVFINGSGSADGPRLIKQMSPCETLAKFYKTTPLASREFSDGGSAEWKAKHAFEAVVIE